MQTFKHSFQKTRRTCLRRPWLLIWLVASCLQPFSACAQNGRQNQNQLQPTESQAIANFLNAEIVRELKEIAQVDLMIRIETMKQLFHLSEQKTKTLEVAAKGAASRYAETFSKNVALSADDLSSNSDLPRMTDGTVTLNNKQLKFPGFATPQPTPITKIEIVIKESWLWLHIQRPSSGTGMSNQGGLDDLFSQAIWKNAIDKALTPGQLKELERYRQKQIADAASSLYLSYLTVHLQLSEQQRLPVRNWLDSLFLEQAENGTLTPRNLTNLSVDRLDDETVLKEILSELQWKLWQIRRILLTHEN